MTDLAAGALGLIVFVLILVFVGFWFGWLITFWAVIGGVVLLIIVGTIGERVR